MCLLPVLPILYNAVQCLLVRYRLLRSFPVAARPFFNLHPNPVGGTVLCSFRKPKFDFQNVLVEFKRVRAQINFQSLPPVQRQGLGASWMRLIQAVGLEPQRKKHFQRIIVDSSLDVDPMAMECSWKSFVFLALGLGVDATDPTFHGLGRGKSAVNERDLHSTALSSETGKHLIELRWHEGVSCHELTEHCSSWSVRRSLAQCLHMISMSDGRLEVLHFVLVVNEAPSAPIAQICDCMDIAIYPVKFSVLRTIHYAITWTLYFEEIVHQIPYETILIPQSLLLSQFEIIEDLHKTPAETLESRISALFPSNNVLVANIISALSSTWNSSEHQELLNGLGGGMYIPTLENPRHLEANKIKQPTQSHPDDHTHDLEKATNTASHVDSLPPPPNPTHNSSSGITFDLYPFLHSSPIFHSLSQAYSPSAISASKPPSTTPAITTIDIVDQSKPEALLARLVIALSAMRCSTKPRGWVTSIASGIPRYKVGSEAGEDMVGKLLGYDGGKCRIE